MQQIAVVDVTKEMVLETTLAYGSSCYYSAVATALVEIMDVAAEMIAV